MSQPLLDLVDRRAVLMAICGKVLPKAMENPLLADRGVGTRSLLAVLHAHTLAAAQTSCERHSLEPTQEMTIRLTVLVGDETVTVFPCR